MAEQRYVVFRPDPTSGWKAQLEDLVQDKWVVHEDGPHQNFPEDGKFAEAHDWALAQHPGMEVFVPMGNYTDAMTQEEDVKAQALSGVAVVEEVAE